MRSDWRPALRMSWRTITKYKTRSLLIALLIALPAALGTAAVLALTAAHIDSDEYWLAQGGHSDAIWAVTRTAGSDGAVTSDAQASEILAAALPAGTQLLRSPRLDQVDLTASTETGAVTGLATTAIDNADPVTDGMLNLTAGTWPAGPSQIALTARDLAALRARVGDTVVLTWEDSYPVPDPSRVEKYRQATTAGAASATVSGIVDLPTELGYRGTVVQSTSGPIPSAAHIDGDSVEFFASYPAGSDSEAIGRAVMARPEANSTIWPVGSRVDGHWWDIGGQRMLPLTLAAICLGLGALVIVLLAGAGIAVATRRMQRDIALMMVAGASPRQVRTLVLAQGLILGAAGAAAGAALGFACYLATRGLAEELLHRRVEGVTRGLAWVFAVFLLAALGGVLAAWLPARTQSQLTPATAMRGLSRASSARPRIPKVSLALMLGGLAAGLFTGWLMSEYNEYGDYSLNYGDSTLLVMSVLSFCVVIVGAVTALPQLMALLGRLARRAPLTLRFGLRDASRSRHRSAPAAAAILAATVVGVPILALVASIVAQGQQTYLPSVPPGIVALSDKGGLPPADLPASDAKTAAQIGAEVPVTGQTWITSPNANANYWCSAQDEARGDSDARCAAYNLAIADPGLLARLAAPGATDAAQLSAQLSQGAVLVLESPDDQHAGAWDGSDYTYGDVTPPFSRVELQRYGWVAMPATHPEYDAANPEANTMSIPSRVTVPVVRLPVAVNSALTDGTAFVTPAGWAAATAQMLPALPDMDKTVAQEAHSRPVLMVAQDLTEAQAAALNETTAGGVSSYQPYSAPDAWINAALIAMIVAVALVGTVIASALSAAESRPDLDTLSAIGAQPKQRRRITSAQAAAVAGVGSVAGLGLGLIVAASLLGSNGGESAPAVIPWLPMAAILLIVPAAAGAVGWLSGGPARMARPNRIVGA